MNWKKSRVFVLAFMILFGGGHTTAQNQNEALFQITDESGYLYGFMNRTGTVVIQPQYTSVHNFFDGLAAVQVSGSLKWGFINRIGKVVIAPKYTKVNDFSEGVAFVQMDDQWQIIDKTGKVISNCEELNDYQNVDISVFHEGLAKFEYDSHSGYINKKGNIAIRPSFDYSGDFENGLAQAFLIIANSAEIIYRFGYIDKNGNFVWSQTRREKIETEDFEEAADEVSDEEAYEEVVE